MSEYTTLPSGIIAPKPIGVQCGYCPHIIFKHLESRGRLFMLDGRPICARDRILRGRTGNHIRHDKALYDKDVIAKDEREQTIADAEVLKVATTSQALTDVMLTR